MTFDPYAPEFVTDPYPHYARLRAESPVLFSETWGITFLARHADVSAILKDRRFGRDVRDHVPIDEVDPSVYRRIYPPEYPTWTRLTRDAFLDLEPPRHTRIRRLVQHAFTRRASESYRARIERTAAEAMDRALDRGRMEVISELATPIPLTMIAELLGVPADHQPQLVEWSHASVRLFDEACTPDEGAAAERATIEFEAYVTEMIAERRRDPTYDDLTSALVEAESDGDRLTDEELVATCILVLNAGHEATVQAIGNAVLALCRWPDQYRRLRAEPGLAPTAVDELLRYDTPLQMFERWVLADVDWAGTRLRRGTKVGLLFGSANHDEEVFAEPGRLDLGRSPNPHISFGAGVHYCVGAPLALVELDVALRAFAQRVSEFEVETSELERVPSLVFRGVKQLPISLA